MVGKHFENLRNGALPNRPPRRIGPISGPILFQAVSCREAESEDEALADAPGAPKPAVGP